MNIVIAATLAILFALAGCNNDEGLISDGFVISLTDQKVCLQPGDPTGDDRCFELDGETSIDNDIDAGDNVRVHRNDGDVTSIELLDQPGQ